MCKAKEVPKNSKDASASGSPAWIPAEGLKRERPPSRLSEVLVQAQGVFARQAGVLMSHSDWKALVGEKVAQRTRVGKLVKGVLLIKVASSAWCQELSFMKPLLLRKLREANFEVEDLRFRVDKLDDSLSAGAAQKRRWMGAGQKNQEEPVLPSELQAKLAQVDDPNLRAAIFEAAERSLRAKRRGSS